MYITFCKYAKLGGVADATAFNRTLPLVEGLIDRRTFGRLRGIRPVPAELEQLIVAGVDLFAAARATDTLKSSSQSDGGVSQSESYMDAADIEKAFKAQIEAYLACTLGKDGRRVLRLIP